MKRILTAAVTATAAAATLSLAVPPAVAATARSGQAAAARIHASYDRGIAGYAMAGAGWRFRYVATTLTVPSCAAHATTAGIRLFGEGHSVGLQVSCGGGLRSIRYDYPGEDRALYLKPRVGDRITISIYRDPSTGTNRFTAINLRSGRRTSRLPDMAGYMWTKVWVTGKGPDERAASDTRLWAFTGTRLTSLDGTRSAIFGPWKTNAKIGTDGHGTIVLVPRRPENHGRNFTIWWTTGHLVPR